MRFFDPREYRTNYCEFIFEWGLQKPVRIFYLVQEIDLIIYIIYHQLKSFISLKILKKMRIIKAQALVAIFFTLVSRILGLTLDLDGTEILGSKDQFRIRLRPQGIGPFTITYTRKPAQWVATERYLFVPKLDSNIYNQVLISVVIQDQSKAEYNISLIFIHNSRHMLMDLNIYNYTAEFDLPPISKPVSTFRSELDRVIKEILRKSNSFDDVNLNFGDVFEQILVFQEIKGIIDTNNVPALIKAISKIPTSNLNCIQQVAYLSEVSTLAYKALKLKMAAQEQDEADFIKNYKDNSPAPASLNLDKNDKTGSLQIAAKTQQLIQKYESDAKQLKATYIVKIQRLKQSYIQYNALSNVLQKSKQSLILTNINRDNFKKDLDSIRARILQISSKFGSLNEADKSTASKAIEGFNKNIQLLNDNVDKASNLIKEQEAAISKIADETDKRKVQSKMLESDINSIQERLSGLYIQLLNLYQPLNSDDLSFLLMIKNGYYLNLRSKADASSILEGKRDIALLQDTINYLDSVLNTMYYSCYGVKNTKVATQSTLPVYEITYYDFLDYVKKFYQNNTHGRLIFANNSVSSIQLQRVSILDSIWTNDFGSVIYEASPSQTAASNRSLCQNPSNLESWTGIISSINNNVIQVRMENADMYYVLLGACTRIEIAGKTKQVGSLILWRGIEISKTIYDGYFALIM